MEWALAVDYGTTVTCAAVSTGDRVELLETGFDRCLPSAVGMDEDGEFVTGRDAVALARWEAGRVERTPKRALAAGSAVRLGDRAADPVDLVAATLRRVADAALRRFGGRAPSRVVLTHPARWTRAETDRLLAAATRAGLSGLELVPDPVAVAAFHGAAVPVDGHVAVLGTGSDSFDTAVLRRTATSFEMCGAGRGPFGGEAVDEALLGLVAGHARGTDPDAWARIWDGPAGRGLLMRERLLEAKAELSSRPWVAIAIEGIGSGVRITRRELERAVEARLVATVDELLRTVRDAGVEPADLEAVHLAGGPSRMPRLAELVRERTGLTPAAHDDPQAVVALGALERLRARPGAGPVGAGPTGAEPTGAEPVGAAVPAASRAAATVDPAPALPDKAAQVAPTPAVAEPAAAPAATAPADAAPASAAPVAHAPAATAPAAIAPAAVALVPGAPVAARVVGAPAAGERVGDAPLAAPAAEAPPAGEPVAGPPTDRPSKRLRPVLVGVGMAALVAGVVVPIAFTTGTASTPPATVPAPVVVVATTATAPASPTAVPARTAPPSPAPAPPSAAPPVPVRPAARDEPDLDARHLALFRALSDAGGVRWASCAAYPAVETAVYATAIQCSPSDPSLARNVVFFKLPDAGAYTAMNKSSTGNVTGSGSCADGQESATTWSNGPAKGFLVCYDDPDSGNFRMAWAASDALVAAVISDPKPATAYTWWKAHKGTLG